MTIDWTHFTPWASLAGGVLIGIGVALLVLLSGRIAGISGIVGGLFMPRGAMDTAWRLSFVGGLLLAPAVYLLLHQASEVRIDAGFGTLVMAGLLVGVGTRYGSGCTSGHGVCGVSRLSPRSLAATAAFMLAGFATVFMVRHILD